MRFTTPLLALALLAAALPSSALAQNFSVDFTNCTEFAGEGPVSLAAAKPLVPHGFTVAEAAARPISSSVPQAAAPLR